MKAIFMHPFAPQSFSPFPKGRFSSESIDWNWRKRSWLD